MLSRTDRVQVAAQLINQLGGQAPARPLFEERKAYTPCEQRDIQFKCWVTFKQVRVPVNRRQTGRGS